LHDTNHRVEKMTSYVRMASLNASKYIE